MTIKNSWPAAITLPALAVLLIGLPACATSYQTARKSFYQANQLYLSEDPEDALIRYCHALNQIEADTDKNPSGRLLKAAIYHRLYLIDARSIYHKAGSKNRDKYAAFSELLSASDRADFLDSAFQDILSAEKNMRHTGDQPLDTFLLIQRNLILADKLSVTLDRENKAAAPTELPLPAEFIKIINAYGYEEIIKSLYLNAWASALIQTTKNIAANEPAQSTNEELYTLSKTRLKNIYYSLRNTTSRLQTPAFQERNNHYHKVVNKIEAGISETDISIFTTASPEQAASDILNETTGKNRLAINPETLLNEVRAQMSMAIEMIIADKPDKAETHLLNALKDSIYARDLSKNLPETSQRLIAITLDNIYLNLYRISALSVPPKASDN